MPEFTPAQFHVVAKILRSEATARAAAWMVLVEGKAVKDAVAATGMLQPSVSKTIRRYRGWHETICVGYLARPGNSGSAVL